MLSLSSCQRAWLWALLAVSAPQRATARDLSASVVAPSAAIPLYGIELGRPAQAPARVDGAPLATARQLVPEAAGAPAATLAQSRTIYLNKNGVTLQPAAVNDARQNRSTIASQPTAIPPWTVDAATWNATVTCMREIFAPFAVRVVTEDPGATLHVEAVFGGEPGLLGLPKNIAGISPFTTSCSVIESSMVFVFTGNLSSSARTVCEIMAQEVAHSYGLDHEVLAADPMTYLSFDGKRWFQDQLAACGEYAERPCGIGSTSCRAKQNSLQLLRERLGVADSVLPRGEIQSPLPGAVVDPSFTVEISASDNIAIAEVSVLLDGEVVGEVSTPPYQVTVKGAAPGERELTAIVVDQARNAVRASARVTVVPDDSSHGLLAGCQVASAGRGPLEAAWTLLAALVFAFPRRRQYNPGMLSGKQRRYLRALGHPLGVTVQLGRGGLSEGVVAAVDRALQDHELIKIKILEGAGLDRHQAADSLAGETKSEVAQVLGNTVLLYRARKEDPAIELP